MASEAADPRTFESWDDAFQYPVPTIRGMEKKLRSNVEDNREKLRSLVGSSYRDLLGTARTIVEVHEQTQEVESLLAYASRKSDSRLFDKLSKNYSKFERTHKAKDQERNTRVSQTRVLQASLNAISQLIRTDGSTLLAAKLLVVARLLQKNLSDQLNIGKEERRLASLRMKLRSTIRRRLEQAGVEVAQITEDLTAFALATSSSPSDVMKHFLTTRREAIQRPVQSNGDAEKTQMLSKIRLYFNTLQECRSIFPDLLKSSLRALGTKPILKDDRIQRMDSLNLDIHEQWFPDEVRNYVPWTRSEELTWDRAKAFSKEWGGATFKLLVEAAQHTASQIESFEVLTDLRRAVLQEWLSLRRGGSSGGFEDVELLSIPFQARLSALVQSQCVSLHERLSKAIDESLDNLHAQDTKGEALLWSEDILESDAGNGASAFRKAVINRRLGKTPDTYRILAEVDKGIGVIDKTRATIKSMEGTRWDDDLDEEEAEGEAALQLFKTLSKDQPTALRSALDDAAQACWRGIEDHFTTSVEETHLKKGNPVLVALTTTRLIRELRTPLSTLWAKEASPLSTLCHKLYKICTTTITEPIAQRSFKVLSKSLSSFVEANRPVDALWDGKPSLPSQSSPAAFKYLRAVTKAMESHGPDVWSAEFVVALKSQLNNHLVNAIQQAVRNLDSLASEQLKIAESKEKSKETETDPQETTSNTKSEEATEKDGSENGDNTQTEAQDSKDEKKITGQVPQRNVQQREKTLQLFFDTVYLRQAFFSKHSDEIQKSKAIEQTLKDLQARAELDEAAATRLRKNSSDYWKRTYLLFGLLVNG